MSKTYIKLDLETNQKKKKIKYCYYMVSNQTWPTHTFPHAKFKKKKNQKSNKISKVKPKLKT